MTTKSQQQARVGDEQIAAAVETSQGAIIEGLRNELAIEQEMSRDLLRANANEIDRLTEERDLLREFARQFAITHDFRPGSDLTRWALSDVMWDELWEAWRNVQFTCLDPGDPRTPVDGGGA